MQLGVDVLPVGQLRATLGDNGDTREEPGFDLLLAHLLGVGPADPCDGEAGKIVMYTADADGEACGDFAGAEAAFELEAQQFLDLTHGYTLPGHVPLLVRLVKKSIARMVVIPRRLLGCVKASPKKLGSCRRNRSDCTGIGVQFQSES